MQPPIFDNLQSALERIPAVSSVLSHGPDSYRQWWVELTIDIDSKIAWNIVQEISHILNYASYDEELKGVFKPVSPPSYKSGGPHDSLTWMIESRSADLTPDVCANWLVNRLPTPLEDESEWIA